MLMKHLLRDPLFVIGAVMMLAASGTYLWRYLPDASTPMTTAATSPVATATPTPTPTPTVTPRTLPARGPAMIPVQKTRPKRDHVWQVGSSTDADSNDLEAVMANVEEGDRIELEQGTYTFILPTNLTKLEISSVAGDEVILNYKETYARHYLQLLTLRRVKLNFGYDGGRLVMIKGWDLKVDFEDVAVSSRGEFRLLFENNTLFYARRVTFHTVSLELKDNAQADLSEVTFTRGHWVISLNQSSQLKLNNVTIQESDVAIMLSKDYDIKLKLEQLKVLKTGRAFGRIGELVKNIDVTKGHFEMLERVADKGLTIHCDQCFQDKIAEQEQ